MAFIPYSYADGQPAALDMIRETLATGKSGSAEIVTPMPSESVYLARIVRAATLVIRELPYVEAARAFGNPTLRIMFRHVLPNIVSPITVQATFIFASAMLAEAGLSFLGLGVPPPAPT